MFYSLIYSSTRNFFIFLIPRRAVAFQTFQKPSFHDIPVANHLGWHNFGVCAERAEQYFFVLHSSLPFATSKASKNTPNTTPTNNPMPKAIKLSIVKPSVLLDAAVSTTQHSKDIIQSNGNRNIINNTFKMPPGVFVNVVQKNSCQYN